ncbi:MAG: ferredoxin [Evtepia sp.]
MKVKVIDGCISCGLCTEEFPDLFQMNEEGIAQVVSSQVPAGLEDQARQAAEDCPVSVILTEE